MNNELNNILCIVIPCYNEASHLRDSVGLVSAELQSLVERGLVGEASEILLVDDGSSDETWDVIRSLCHRDEISGIKLLHNVGHQNALVAGLSVAAEISDISITLDADLQDDIGVMGEMISKWRDGKCDVVYGVRNNRAVDSEAKRNTANKFYWWLKQLNADCIENAADFRLLSKRAMQCVLECKDKVICLRAMIPEFKLKSDVVYYSRKAGVDRPTSYTDIRMIKLALAGFFACKDFSVRVASWYLMLGACAFGLALLLGMFRIRAFYFISLVALMAGLFGAVVLILMYLGTILWEVKDRPLFTIMERLD